MFIGTLVFSQDCIKFNRVRDLNTDEIEKQNVLVCTYPKEKVLTVKGIPFNITDADETDKSIVLLGVNSKGAEFLFISYKHSNVVDIYSEDVRMNVRLYSVEEFY